MKKKRMTSLRRGTEKRGRRLLCFVLAALCLAGPALAATTDALGLYTPLDAAREQEQAEAVRAIGELVVQENMTDGETATVLHDWLVLNCRYNVTLYRDMAYGALVQRQAICRGYARGFQSLAEAQGLACDYSFSVPLQHAWALVELDGSYYYVDPTWDDNHFERIGFVNHRHFLFASAQEELFNHYGGDSAVWAEGGLYEAAPWRGAVSRVIFDGRWCYYIDGDFQFIRCDRDSWQTEVIFSCAERWPEFYEIDGRQALATGLVLMRGRLWFNTPTAICSVDREGGGFRQELTPELEGGWVCGIDVREGRLVYSVARQQDDSDWELRDAGISAWGAWGCEYDLEDFWDLLKGI